MTDTERKEAIKEVLTWVKSGKQDLQNGADEIETINHTYAQLHNKNQSAFDIIIQSYLPKCKRVEVVNNDGESYSNPKCNAVQVELRDDNKTLAIFINEKKS